MNTYEAVEMALRTLTTEIARLRDENERLTDALMQVDRMVQKDPETYRSAPIARVICDALFPAEPSPNARPMASRVVQPSAARPSVDCRFGDA